ncbi:MAG TPA: phytoene desaturase family protein [Roseiflexaceae bacterium]|nr:phytoene desaturase family protein [Roseiflexaceae bacterium]
MNPTSVLVIGAGVGGIAAAARLAQHGLHVTVLEKNARPGGRCDRVSRGGHHFDTGPTLFIMPHVYEAEFAALGTPLPELVDLQRVDPTYCLVFDDGSQLALTSDLRSMQDQLEAIEPDSFQGFLRYMGEGHRYYQQAMQHLVNHDFRTAGEFFNLRNLPLLFTLRPFSRHYHHMAAYFNEPRLKFAFTFQDVYMGLSPFEAPATFSMMPYTELAHGVWYPRGGMYRVVEALMEIARRAGVTFAFNTAVKQIKLNDTRVKGVVLEDGQRLEADAVLANADLPYVYQDLLPWDQQTEQLARKRYSCSVISFFWGVNREYKALGPHTLFLADDYRSNFEQIGHGLTVPTNASLYIHAPARLDPGMAPAGEDTLIAVVPVGHMNEQGDYAWKVLIAEARQVVLRRLALLGISDVERHIKFEMCFTPLSWHQRYNLVRGATHGLCHNAMQLGYFRPANRHPRYHNLYFVGASTHPGTGMPTALISARLTARRMLDDFGASARVNTSGHQ